MSLALAAKHLESQGRGPDTMLVHMAPNEIHLLDQFAKAHGTHLTVNPKTGLLEAGLLSMALGAVGTALFPEFAIPIAAGIGLADYAMTGSLGQGLMAGLGAWSGGNLASGISNLATTQAPIDASLTGAKEAALTQQYAGEIPQVAGNGEIGMASQFPQALSGASVSGDVGLNGIPMTSGNVGMGNSFPATMGGSGPGITSDVNSMFNSNVGANFDKFTTGANKLFSSPVDSIKQMWNAPGGQSTLISAGLQVAPEIYKAFQPTPYVPPATEKNPMNLKTISPDFKGTFPDTPNPYPQAQYTNYTTNPYTTYAAGGGLQTANYAQGDFVKAGLSLLNQKPQQAPIVPSDPGSPYGGPGIYQYEQGSELDTPTEHADKLLTSLFGNKKATKLVGTLGAISYDPAVVAANSIQKDQSTQSSKEGGLQSYALGGLSMGHLGGYSDGGRLLKGPGDGVSDSIPASIGNKQPARLAEGELVIPARIVSELGNGSTDAGAKRLYAMMDRIKAKRAKSKDIAADTKTYNLLPA